MLYTPPAVLAKVVASQTIREVPFTKNVPPQMDTILPTDNQSAYRADE